MDVTLETSEMGTYFQDIMSDAEKAYLMTDWCGEGVTSSLWGRGAFVSALGIADEEVFTLLEEESTILDRDLRDAKLQMILRQNHNQLVYQRNFYHLRGQYPLH
jgi:hypothetical protein